MPSKFSAKLYKDKKIFKDFFLFFASFLCFLIPNYFSNSVNEGLSFLSTKSSNYYVENLVEAFDVLDKNDTDIIYSINTEQFELIGRATYVNLEKVFDDNVNRVYFELRFVNGDEIELLNYYNSYFKGAYISGSKWARRSFLLISNTHFMAIIYEKDAYSVSYNNFENKIVGNTDGFSSNFSFVDFFSNIDKNNIESVKRNLQKAFFAPGFESYIKKNIAQGILTTMKTFLLIFFLLIMIKIIQSNIKITLYSILGCLSKIIREFLLISFLSFIVSFIIGLRQMPIIVVIFLVLSFLWNKILKTERENQYVE